MSFRTEIRAYYAWKRWRTHDTSHPYLAPVVNNRYLLQAWRLWDKHVPVAGRWLTGASMLAVVYSGGFWSEPQVYVLLALVVGLWIVSAGAAILGRPRLQVSVHQPLPAEAGESLLLEITVLQRSAFAIHDLQLAPLLPDGLFLVGKEGLSLPQLAKGETARLSALVSCPDRGLFTLERVRARTAFPFGLLNAISTYRTACRVLVAPTYVPLMGLSVGSLAQAQSGGMLSQTGRGAGMEFAGNREYRPGDEASNIDWRATARLNAPIVKDFRDEFRDGIVVVVDDDIRRDAEWAEPAEFESAVSLAASIGAFATRADFPVSCLAAGPDVHDVGRFRGDQARGLILEVLAHMEPRYKGDYDAVCAGLMPYADQPATVFVLLLGWDERRRNFVETVAAQWRLVRVIVVSESKPQANPGRGGSLAADIVWLTPKDIAAGNVSL